MIICAEIGINWDGDFKLLKKMILDLSHLGIDAVKIQYLKPSKMYNDNVRYDLNNKKVKIKKYLDKFKLNASNMIELRKLTNDLGLMLGASVVDLKSVSTIFPYIDFYKVASSESNYFQLHEEINKTGKNCFVSIGGIRNNELVKLPRYYNKSKLVLVYCNYSYFTLFDYVNLEKIKELRLFHEDVGFSNHTLDYEVIGPMCVSMGCKYFEFHVTPYKQRQNKGEHFFSLTYDESKKLVRNIRKAEILLGDKNAGIRERESALRRFAYRSAFAKNDINSGERIKQDDIIWMRNGNSLGNGFEPIEEYMIINRIPKKDIKKNDKILREDLW